MGAQNAGKSSLINAMRRAVQRDAAKRTGLTVAALPGALLLLLGSCLQSLLRLAANGQAFAEPLARLCPLLP